MHGVTPVAYRGDQLKRPGLGSRVPIGCFAVCFGLLTGCSGGDRQVSGPGGGGGGTQRPSLTVTVQTDEDGASLATALGWSDGVADAEVHLLRNGTAEWELRTTDASGVVRYENLVPGLYRLYAGRRLTVGEAESAATPIRAFGDGRTLNVNGSTDVELRLHPNGPGTLVISEVNNDTPPPWENPGGGNLDGLYLEVYNNSSDVLFLDGMLLGAAYPFAAETEHTPCSVSEPVRTDSSRVYGRWFLRFPGSGSEYPIQPGEAKVIAQAAIDLTPIHPDFLDLSGSAFEIGGEANADNPAVPNMIDVGLGRWWPQHLLAAPAILFLAEPLDPQSLPIVFRDSQGRGYVGVPAGLVTDIAAFTPIFPDLDREYPPCIPTISPVFDRYEGGFIHIALGMEEPDGSLQRLFLRDEGSRRIVQNANTTAVDFVLRPQTPGWVP